MELKTKFERSALNCTLCYKWGMDPDTILSSWIPDVNVVHLVTGIV